MLRMVSTWLFLLFWCCDLNAAAEKLSHQAYIWQRNWSPQLISAIHASATVMDGFTVLVAEITPSAGGAKVVRVPVQYDVLQSTGLPITLAIRVGNYSGPFDSNQQTTQCLLAEVKAAIASARADGIKPTAIEIDFDCATSKLEGYVEWLSQMHNILGDVSLSITTLPTWMNRPKAFRELVHATDHFVLQVHSIKKPESIGDDVALCEPEQTLDWASEAAKYGIPFRVALPTYAYRLGYNQHGQLAEVSGENASPLQNPDWQYRIIRAEPETIANLVKAFKERQPQHFEGIIWYRLPIAHERLNWDPITWRTVIAGQTDASHWKAQAVFKKDGAIEIQIEQTGLLAAPPPKQVILNWENANSLVWDGQRNFDVKATLDHGLIWQWPDKMEAPLLPQGTQWTIGWLRLDNIPKLQISVIPNAN
ncbi:DUF3142 domain-containing protein [Rubellicoccus peritrichatus]|uniref:DUF3142 domain-containing protein n=1 Tax=Rubellicoccus peritrichatus TaxID=3080537 RepID=A0AAQ3L4R3_9BACT|nr:DUF3142 domain-containing protein [Puniceicoccus sp. CR14]WOO39329.1 DUF3142 domain-containing protein [Puniceicoccus sp. CR14]